MSLALYDYHAFSRINRKITFTVPAIVAKKNSVFVHGGTERLARVIRAFFRIGQRNIADERRFIGSDAALGEDGGEVAHGMECPGYR